MKTINKFLLLVLPMFALFFYADANTKAAAQKIGVMFSESSEKFANTTHPAGSYNGEPVAPKVDYSSTLDKELKAFHMYKQQGFDVTEVNESMLSDIQSLKQFDAIVFPYTVMMNHKQRENVKAFIRSGGGVVFAFQTARNESAHFPQPGQPDISPLIFHVKSWVFEWDNLTEVFQSRFIDDIVLNNFNIANNNASHPIITNTKNELGRDINLTYRDEDWVEVIMPWQNKRNKVTPLLYFGNYTSTSKPQTMQPNQFAAATASEYGKGRVVQIGFKIYDYLNVDANANWEDNQRGLAYDATSGSKDAEIFMKNALNWVAEPHQNDNKRYYNLSLYTEGIDGYIAPNGKFVYRPTATIINNGNVPARGTLQTQILDAKGNIVAQSHSRYIPGLAADTTNNNADKRDISRHTEKFEIYMPSNLSGTYTARTIFIEGRDDRKNIGEKFATIAESKTLTRSGNKLKVGTTPMFKDVSPSLEGYYDIKNLQAIGVVNGIGNNYFAPNNSINRIQATNMILRALGIKPSASATMNVSDWQRGQYGYDVLATGMQYGIITAQDGKINGAAPMTRGEMAKALVNGFNLTGLSNTTFNDVAEGSEYYNYVQTLISLDITTGYDDNTFRPNNSVTRRNFSQFVNRTIYNQSQ